MSNQQYPSSTMQDTQIDTPIDTKPPTVSVRRRLQNRIAQRKFRERRASTKKMQHEPTEYHPLSPPGDGDDGTQAAAAYGCNATQQECLEDIAQHASTRFFFDDSFMNPDSWMLAAMNPAYMTPDAAAVMGGGGGHADVNVTATPNGDFGSVSSPQHNTAATVTAAALAVAQQQQQHQYHALASSAPTSSHLSSAMSSADSSLATSPVFLDDYAGLNTQFSGHAASSMTPLGVGFVPQQQAMDTDTPRRSSLGDMLQGSTAGISPPPSPEEPRPFMHVAVCGVACGRDRSVVATLLKHGLAVDERDSNGRTALHLAAEMGDEALVTMLLRHGADALARDARGWTPLYIAISEGNNEIVDLLLSHTSKSMDATGAA